MKIFKNALGWFIPNCLPNIWLLVPTPVPQSLLTKSQEERVSEVCNLIKKKFLPINTATFLGTRFYRIPPGRLLVLVMSIAKKKQPPLNCNRVTSTYYIKEVTIVSKSDNSFIRSFIHLFKAYLFINFYLFMNVYLLTFIYFIYYIKFPFMCKCDTHRHI